jgi:hypothetical protein
LIPIAFTPSYICLLLFIRLSLSSFDRAIIGSAYSPSAGPFGRDAAPIA